MELLLKNPDLADLAAKILRGYATDADFDRAKLEDVIAIKCDTGAPHYAFKAEPFGKAAGDAPRTKRYVASDETVDRMGDIVRVNGWELERFKENPVALWAHNNGGFPIGTVNEMHKGQRNGRAALIESIKYLPEGTTPAADAVWRLVDQGVVKGVSVGFLSLKPTWVDDEDERKRLGLGRYGVVHERSEQLELSNCAIPANPSALATRAVKEALVDMVKRGQITERDAEAVVELGEHRTIQVQGVDPVQAAAVIEEEIPKIAEKVSEQVEPELTDEDVLFRVTERGLERVKLSVLQKPRPIEADTDEFREIVSDLNKMADIEERLENIEASIDSLSQEVRDLPEKIEQLMRRSSKQGRDLLRTLEVAVGKAASRVNTELT